MKSINLIWIPNLAQITSDTIQIYRANNEHIDKIVDKIKEVEGEYIDIPLYMDEYSKENNRVSLLLTIADYIDDEEDVDINQYFILPYGEMVKIKDFNTLVNTANKFYTTYLDSLSENIEDTKNILSKREAKLSAIEKDPNTRVTDKLCLLTEIGFCYAAIQKYMNEHQEEIQDTMNDAIKEVREEAVQEEEIKTELDMINSSIKTVLKDKKEFENEEFVRCIYNQHEISQIDMIEELSSHYVPEYMPKVKNINDTLDDEYEIETTHLLITRDIGGGLRVKRK
jgi:hypothetical protein